jgi:hypothetical protein
MLVRHHLGPGLLALALLAVGACSGDDPRAWVRIQNDFANPEAARQPPWTICHAWFGGVDFGTIALDASSLEREVDAGLGYVLMVAAWSDPTCQPENCLPIASKVEEETVDGQHRVITIGLTNHQGPCPPEGVQPLPEDLYERIRALAPEYDFEPYATRTDNPQCLE